MENKCILGGRELNLNAWRHSFLAAAFFIPPSITQYYMKVSAFVLNEITNVGIEIQCSHDFNCPYKSDMGMHRTHSLTYTHTHNEHTKSALYEHCPTTGTLVLLQC